MNFLRMKRGGNSSDSDLNGDGNSYIWDIDAIMDNDSTNIEDVFAEWCTFTSRKHGLL